MLIYTDGCCYNHGNQNKRKKSAYAFVAIHERNIVHTQAEKVEEEDILRIELIGILKALQYYDTQYCNLDENNNMCIIKTDSQIAVNSFLGNINRNKHRDIWDQIEDICYKYMGKIRVYHVEGHSTDKMNKYADKLAKIEARKLIG